MVPELILGAASIANNAINASKNLNQQEKTFAYQKWLNQQTMNREDNAYQRAVNDMRAAGLSPLGATAAASSPLQSASAPQKDLSGVNSAVGQIMQTRLNDATVSNLHAQSAKNYADSEKTFAETAQTLIDNVTRLEYRQNELDLQKAEIDKLVEDGKISKVEAQKRSQVLDAQIKSLNTQVKKLNQEINLQKETADYYRKRSMPVNSSFGAGVNSTVGFSQWSGANFALKSNESSAKSASQSDANKLASKVHLEHAQSAYKELYNNWLKQSNDAKSKGATYYYNWLKTNPKPSWSQFYKEY